MYSPVSPRKSTFSSSKSSPRKPLLSPSEINPFSFSSETLNLFDNDQLQQNNGIIPMSMSFPRPNPSSGIHVGAHSQPRTPTSGLTSILQQNIHSAPGRSLSLGGSGSFGGSGSTGGGGRSIREFDETFRELRKENFNLKLRIYFLEERLGSSRLAAASAGSKEELVQSNYELKFQCESLKYEIREKTDLLAEASSAIEQLEARLATLSSEREEERRRLEDKLRQLEDDIGDHQAAAVFAFNPDIGLDIPDAVTHGIMSSSSSPSQSPAKSNRRKVGTSSSLAVDEDENLLNEVEEEMRRGVEYSSPPSKDQVCQTTTPPGQQPPGPLGLAVLEEKDEAMVSKLEELEQQVEQLTVVIQDTEYCLEEKVKEIHELSQDLNKKEILVETLRREKFAKAEEAANAQKEVSSLSTKLVDQGSEFEQRSKEFQTSIQDLSAQLDEARKLKSELEVQAKNLKELLEQRDKHIEELSERLSMTDDRIKYLEEELFKKEEEISAESRNKSDKNLTGSDYQVFSSPRPRPLKFSSTKPDRGNFQIVTQTLHIPATRLSDDNAAVDVDTEPASEVNKLRRDIKKLKEYLKTSVQERKLLLKKIGTLNERVADANLRKSMSPARIVAVPSSEKVEAAVQCDPIVEKSFESIVQILSVACHGADLLRSRLDAVSTNFDTENQYASIYQSILDDMKDLTRNIVDNITTAVHILSVVQDGAGLDEGRRSSSSLSANCLPDPSEIDLSSVPILNENTRQKLALIESMEHQLEEKNKVIQDQHDVLQEYRAEIFRLRDPRRAFSQKPMDRPKRRFRRSGDGAQRSENAPPPPSEEEDTWSEPDVGASRKRMGLSQHVLALIEKTGHSLRPGEEGEGDSSDVDKNQREKLKSFYSLDYTGQDFSDRDDLNGGCKDYAKIIEELQSHRREIEKLHLDLATLAPSAQMIQETEDNRECAIGSLRCLLNGLHEFSRTMDELAYQVDLSETVDSGNVSGDEFEDGDEFDDSEEDGPAGLASKDLDEFHVQLCHACSNSLPLELENCIHRCGSLLAGSAFSLQRLRHACCRLRNKLRRRNGQLADKRLLLSQLEESVLPLREKGETADRLAADLTTVRDELSRKTRDVQELQAKMNDNYKLVAELSAENLKLSSEKLRMEQLVDEVRQEESLLRAELNKAQSLVEVINASSPRLPLRRPHAILNRPSHLRLNADTTEPLPRSLPSTVRSSSSETSSSFDFVPAPQPVVLPPPTQPLRHSPTSNCQILSSPGENNQRRCMACFVGGVPINCPPPLPINSNSACEMRSPGQDRRGKYNRGGGRGRGCATNFHLGRAQWKGPPPDYTSDRPRDGSRGRRSSFEKMRPQSTTGINSEVSSPDLGVDLGCSDPFSSLERSNGIAITGRARDGGTVDFILEENRQLRQKLTETRGALKETVDRLAASSRQFKKDQWLSTHSRPSPRQYSGTPSQLNQTFPQQETSFSRSPNKSNSKTPMTPTHRPPSASQRN